jgi:hypothetical protein
MLPKPKHLGPPDEVSLQGRRVHIYQTNPEGKYTLEALIWLCTHYRFVTLVSAADETDIEFHCRAPYVEIEYEPKY